MSPIQRILGMITHLPHFRQCLSFIAPSLSPHRSPPPHGAQSSWDRTASGPHVGPAPGWGFGIPGEAQALPPALGPPRETQNQFEGSLELGRWDYRGAHSELRAAHTAPHTLQYTETLSPEIGQKERV